MEVTCNNLNEILQYLFGISPADKKFQETLIQHEELEQFLQKSEQERTKMKIAMWVPKCKIQNQVTGFTDACIHDILVRT